MEEVSILPQHFTELLKAVQSGKITELKAKRILNEFIPKSFSIKSKLKKEAKISKAETEKIVNKILKKHKKAVQDYKKGVKKAFNFLMGQIMKESDRKADFKIAIEILSRELRN